MPKIPELVELMKAGVHFGHQKSKWHPKMDQYIFTSKNGIHVINLEETQKCLETALNFLKETVTNGGTVLFLGTKRQAQPIIKEAAEYCGMPYIVSRWLGGTLTNASSVLNLVKKFRKLKKDLEISDEKKYTKKERLQIQREVDRLEVLIGGISNLNKIPDVLFVVDCKDEKTAVLEAVKKEVPIVAICDTNVNPDKIDYPIPSNDDATSALKLLVNLASEAISEVNGIRNEPKKIEEKPVEAKKEEEEEVKEKGTKEEAVKEEVIKEEK